MKPMLKEQVKKKLLCISLDGWGVAPASEANIFDEQRAPYLSSLLLKYPYTQIATKASVLGFEHGPTNKEMGHQVICSGMKAAQKPELLKSELLLAAIKELKKNQGTAHVLLSINEQSDWTSDNLKKCLELARRKKLTKLYIHGVLTNDLSQEYWQKLQKECEGQELVEIVGLLGADYALNDCYDWDKTARSYDYLTTESLEKENKTTWTADWSVALVPTKLVSAPALTTDDLLIILTEDLTKNFQLANALTVKNFEAFERKQWCDWTVLSAGKIADGLQVLDLLTEVSVKNLQQVLVENNLRQIWLTDSYGALALGHYASGAISPEFWKHDYKIINSAVYADWAKDFNEVNEKLINEALSELTEDGHDLVWVSLPSLDLAGQMADLELMKSCLTDLDELLAKLIDKAINKDYVVFLTASCARSEAVRDLVTGQDKKQNSDGLVPLVLMAKDLEGQNFAKLELVMDKLNPLSLLNLAPTILAHFGIEAPEQMKASSLL